jgi:hypothetical protein
MTTVLETHLTPQFPPLPAATVQWQNIDISGLHANVPIDVNSHNLYENVPATGINLAAIITAQNTDLGPWQPPNLPQGWTATQTLLGYRPTRQ